MPCHVLTYCLPDCRVCNRRRIRCDRALPSCEKCARKGIECPGYKPKLRWTNAIAVRGRFRGLGGPDALLEVAHGLQASEPNLSQRVDGAEIGGSPSYQSGLALERQLPQSMTKRLLQYYSTNIAPLMVWLDSDQNEYKRLVIPLAEEDTILRLAVLAISAAHMPREEGLGVALSQSIGETAILMITQRVRQMTQFHLDNPPIDSNGGSAEGILAAMLILSNNSLLKSELSHAQSHRQAARILMESLALRRSPNDELALFLRNQLAIYDVLACTTLFNYEHIKDAILPQPDPTDVLFGDFLNILHRVTVLSLDEKEPVSQQQLEVLEVEFELASGSTLLAAGPLTHTMTRSSRQDFIRLTHAYHHAGILYAYKRLCASPEILHIVRDHTEKLFLVLERIEDMNSALHNLAWPLFVAGTCCYGDEKRMEMINSLCQTLSSSTRFEHYANISTFLQELWQSSNPDWTLLASQWESKGTPIIAV